MVAESSSHTLLDPFGMSDEAITEAMHTADYIIIDTPGDDRKMNRKLFGILATQGKKPATFISGGSERVMQDYHDFRTETEQQLYFRIRNKGGDYETTVRGPDGKPVEKIAIKWFDDRKAQQGIVEAVRISREKSGIIL